MSAFARYIVQVELLERAQAPIGELQWQVFRERIWNRDAEDAGPLGRENAVRRIFERDRLVSPHAELLEREQIQGGVGLHGAHVVARAYGIELVQEPELPKIASHPFLRGAGRDRQLQSAPFRRRDTRRNAGKQRLRVHELQPTRVAGPFEIRAIKRTPGLLFEVGVQVEPTDRPDARRIFVEWK